MMDKGKDKKVEKPVKKKKPIDELVDSEGSPIEGSGVDGTSEIKTAPQQTSDDFAQQADQATRYYTDTRMVHVRESAKNMMRKMVEDIVTNKLNPSDVITKQQPADVNNNQIPDIEELAQTKPTAARHAQIFVYDINKTPLSQDELAIVLNYILDNIDTTQISPEFKAKLKNLI